MIDDLQIIEAAHRAERIKAAMPQLGVSADAIFGALLLGKPKPGRPAEGLKLTAQPTAPKEPPEWFTAALTTLKGQTLTCSEFLMQSGRFPCSKLERNAVGRWLRQSGRLPRKRGKQRVQAFDI
mgnify:CR=1 FL=1